MLIVNTLACFDIPISYTLLINMPTQYLTT